MLSISQFTEKFLEQNLSKFLYHIEVTVRCRRGSGLSFLFTHFIVFTSFSPCSSSLTLFLSSSLPFSLVIPTSFRRFLTPWFTSFLLFPSLLFALVFPSSSSFFLLSLLLSFLSPPTHFSSTHSLLFPLLHSPSAPPPFAILPPPPPSHLDPVYLRTTNLDSFTLNILRTFTFFLADRELELRELRKVVISSQEESIALNKEMEELKVLVLVLFFLFERIWLFWSQALK